MKKTVFIASLVSIMSLLFFCWAYNVPNCNAFFDKDKGQHSSTVTMEEGVKMKILQCGTGMIQDEVDPFMARKDIEILKVIVFASSKGYVRSVAVFYRMKKKEVL